MFTDKQANFNQFEQNVSVLKSFFKKPIILILGILHTIFGACFLVSFALNHFLMSAFQFRPSFLFELISIALYVPMAIGYVIIYIKSKDQNPDSSPMSGFKVLHITSIVKLLLSIATLLLAITSYNEITSAITDLLGDSFLGSLLAFISTVILFVIITIITLTFIIILLFYICQIRFFANIKKNLTNIAITYKGAMLFSIFNIILAVLTAIAATGGLIEIFSGEATYSIRALLPNITLILSCVLFIANTIMALGYRKHVKRTIFGVNTIDTELPVSLINEPVKIETPTNKTTEIPTQNYKTYADLEQQNTSSCPYCKANTTSDTIFCNSCGRKIK